MKTVSVRVLHTKIEPETQFQVRFLRVFKKKMLFWLLFESQALVLVQVLLTGTSGSDASKRVLAHNTGVSVRMLSFSSSQGAYLCLYRREEKLCLIQPHKTLLKDTP